ncbi:MAG: ComF family protein [Anaerolineaceae bacterium]|nr:ComF family protein [Anaerolineaceae bacterium]
MAGQYKRPAFTLYHLSWCAIDWLYPPNCGGCGALGERWCPVCQEQTPKISGNICPSCGYPQNDTGICPSCVSSTPVYNALRSWGFFKGPLKEALHRLKYQHDMGLGEILSIPLIDMVNNLGWEIDGICPVPISKKRSQERGYNQASLLAWPISLALNIPYFAKGIAKIRDTRSQVGLSKLERMQNVSGAFQARHSLVKCKSIMIVDDVTTTGSTIQACAQALLEAGAKAVYGFTLARAAYRENPIETLQSV